MKGYHWVSLATLLIVYFLFRAVTSPLPRATMFEASSSSTLGVKTKTSGCVIDGALPDQTCTPGAVFPNVTKDQVCTPGYAKSVRNVSTQEKSRVYSEYGVTTHYAGQYEVDHLISLELGGSNDISNLWPEAALPKPGFHEKDEVENYLHSQLCAGEISLDQAQQEISTNWLKVYQSLSGSRQTGEPQASEIP